MRKVLLICTAISLFISSCTDKDDNSDNDKIEVSVSSSQQLVYNGNTVTFSAQVIGDDTKEATFFFDGKNIGSLIQKPYSLNYFLKDIEPGSHKITCVVRSMKDKTFSGGISISSKLRLGDEYQGGKIYKLNSDGQSGLICSLKDLENTYASIVNRERVAWAKSNKLLGTSLDNGKENTLLMALNSTNTDEAGYYFRNGYSYDGYNDWYIPSFEELKLLKANKDYVGNFSTLTDWNGIYWSSSELGETRAYMLNFNVLMLENREKYSLFKIRPIRQF